MFIECYPHEPVIHIHEESLRKLLPSEAPEFRMKIWYASVKDKKSTKVLLIQAAPKHVIELNKAIQEVENITYLNIYPGYSGNHSNHRNRRN
jgi:hypothetical protein